MIRRIAPDNGRMFYVNQSKPKALSFRCGCSPRKRMCLFYGEMRIFMAMTQVLVLPDCPAEYREQLLQTAKGRCAFLFKDPSWTREFYQQMLEKAEVILGEPRNEDFAFCRNLRFVQSMSSGVNYYVQGGCFPKDAVLCCMTGFYGNIIAEHMLAMTMSLCRRLPEYRDQQHRHEWKLLRYDKQLEDSTVLILGAGDIGTTLAKWLRPMVGKIIGVRRTIREFPDCYDEMYTLESLEALLPLADVVLCALPQTPQTMGMLDEKMLRLMKDDAVLVNGGRGSLIDQNALCRLLDEGKFWGVGLEVTFPEPLPSDHPLWDKPRLIITPHAAGNSFAPGSPLDKKLWKFMIRNLGRYLDGEQPENQVDFLTGYKKA